MEVEIKPAKITGSALETELNSVSPEEIKLLLTGQGKRIVEKLAPEQIEKIKNAETNFLYGIKEDCGVTAEEQIGLDFDKVKRIIGVTEKVETPPLKEDIKQKEVRDEIDKAQIAFSDLEADIRLENYDMNSLDSYSYSSISNLLQGNKKYGKKLLISLVSKSEKLTQEIAEAREKLKQAEAEQEHIKSGIGNTLQHIGVKETTVTPYLEHKYVEIKTDGTFEIKKSL